MSELLGLVDFDVVDYTNLQRQIIHATPDVGRSKVESADEKIAAINPFVKVEAINAKLTSANALELFKQYDIIADGTDNFATRYLVNDACVLTGKPNVFASVFRFEGQASVFATETGPCYRCLYPEPPPPGMVPSCAEGGVLGVLPGMLGIIQATEVIKLICDIGQPLIGRMLLVDALAMKFQELKLKRDPECPVCGIQSHHNELIDYDQFCGIRGAEPGMAGDVRPEELKRRLRCRREVIYVLDVREPHEYQIREPRRPPYPARRTSEPLRGTRPQSRNRCPLQSRWPKRKAVDFLRQQGFKNVHNLAGGITAWSDKVDPSVAEVLRLFDAVDPHLHQLIDRSDLSALSPACSQCIPASPRECASRPASPGPDARIPANAASR